MKSLRKDTLPLALIILDGFGHQYKQQGNAVAQASLPTWKQLLAMYPHTLLHAAGNYVGLPNNYHGNSEVGHLTLGAGKAIPNLLKKINDSIDDLSFFKDKKLSSALTMIAKSEKRLHLMGLLSNGGVHSHEHHLHALLIAAQQHQISHIFIHVFADGRDVAPKSLARFLEKLEEKCKELNTGVIASIHGRFYAMDRDNNWERTEKSYALLNTPSSPMQTASWRNYLASCYHQQITDEFLPPIMLNNNGVIKKEDGVIFFNFRPDRARQLTSMFLNKTILQSTTYPVIKDLSFFLTFAPYFDDPQTNKRYNSLFKPSIAQTTLLETIQNQTSQNITILTIAESEKYTHVTRFFHGTDKTEVPHENQVMIPSIKAKTYEQEPKMSARKITEHILTTIREEAAEIIIANYANADMVGHSGNLEATIKACEYLDSQITLLYHEIVEKRLGSLIITADHGNAEHMISYHGQTAVPHTAHTANKVPFLVAHQYLRGKSLTIQHEWGLAHVAPTILTLLGLSIPSSMEQESLLSKDLIRRFYQTPDNIRTKAK